MRRDSSLIWSHNWRTFSVSPGSDKDQFFPPYPLRSPNIAFSVSLCLLRSVIKRNITTGRNLGSGRVVRFTGSELLLCQSHDFVGDFLAGLSLSANSQFLCCINERVGS